MHRVPGGAAGLSVQVVALDEHRVVGQAPDPNVALADEVELDSLADVKPSPLAGLGSVDVAQRPQAEPVAAGRVDVSIDRHTPPSARNFEHFSNLWKKSNVVHGLTKKERRTLPVCPVRSRELSTRTRASATWRAGPAGRRCPRTRRQSCGGACC